MPFCPRAWSATEVTFASFPGLCTTGSAMRPSTMAKNRSYQTLSGVSKRARPGFREL